MPNGGSVSICRVDFGARCDGVGLTVWVNGHITIMMEVSEIGT